PSGLCPFCGLLHRALPWAGICSHLWCSDSSCLVKCMTSSKPERCSSVCGWRGCRGCDALVATCSCGTPAAAERQPQRCASPASRRGDARGGQAVADTCCDEASQPREMPARHFNGIVPAKGRHIRSAGTVAGQCFSRVSALGKVPGWLLLLVLFLTACLRAEENADRASVLIAVGAGGEEKYGDTFAKWA